MLEKLTPFVSATPEAVLRDLADRLARTIWPDQLDGAGWAYGTELNYLRALCDYWRDGFDWRAAEARINAFPQFTCEIGGERVHFYHILSPHAAVRPLIITHGYPGSVCEFLDIFGPLTDPTAHGGDAADAFHVVAPSIPGYGFSGPTRRQGFDMDAAADVNLALMAGLGYDRYFAQGGDWGSAISSGMALKAPDRVAALHLNFIVGRPADPDNPLDGVMEEERAQLEWKRTYDAWESGYQAIQGTKPQSLAYGLTDSPAGLAAWIVEKFKTWSDCGDDVEASFTKDQLLENITLYWITRTINSAMRMYYETTAPSRWRGGLQEKVTVPTGHARFPAEIRPTPRAWAEQLYNIVHWRRMARGGHFAALEQPEAFVEEVRGFFRAYR